MGWNVNLLLITKSAQVWMFTIDFAMSAVGWDDRNDKECLIIYSEWNGMVYHLFHEGWDGQ